MSRLLLDLCKMQCAALHITMCKDTIPSGTQLLCLFDEPAKELAQVCGDLLPTE